MKNDKQLHEVNGYIHNIVNLLKFIKQDAKISNKETEVMLDLAIAKEANILASMDLLNKREDAHE
jgi:hypothetical protein